MERKVTPTCTVYVTVRSNVILLHCVACGRDWFDGWR